MNRTTSDLGKLLSTARDAAILAGGILREGFDRTKHIRYKGGIHNIVTEYDVASEEAIIKFISSTYPDHHFLAEESGGDETSTTVRWIIDPLDGTVNFAHGIPIYSVSIAAELDGEIVCGAIYQPVLEEMFCAAKGMGATLNGKSMKVSDCSALQNSILVTGFPYNVSQNPDHCIDQFSSLVHRGIPIRRLGSAAIDLAYTACGRFDGFWEVGLQPWDVAAGILIVQESGGAVTDFNSKKISLRSNNILATNSLIHDEFTEFLRGFRNES